MKQMRAIDEEEKMLMDEVENGKAIPASYDEINAVVSAIRGSKTRTISLRMNEDDLKGIRSKADRAGMPYQTLIGAVLHRYLNGDIILKEQV